jgi:hypothetical protein
VKAKWWAQAPRTTGREDLRQMSTSEDFAEFLTLPLYEEI